MECKIIIESISELLGKMLQHSEHPYLTEEQVVNTIKKIEVLTNKFKRQCMRPSDITMWLNRLESLLRALKHFYKIRKSADKNISNNPNIEKYIVEECNVLIDILKKILQMTNN